MRWHGASNEAELSRLACERILHAASAAIAARGRFLLVLAGGSTPQAVYGQLALAVADWQHWHLYFGDERCLPAEHPERNSHMAALSWLSGSAVPARNIHPIPAERGAIAAAQAYAATLQGIGDFDLVLLGLGEDGHTASLFPGHPWDSPDCAEVLAVSDAPKPPPERVSLSASRLSRSTAVLFLVAGEGKRGAVQQWRCGYPLPALAIQPTGGVDVLILESLLEPKPPAAAGR
jgi:6-phosphogluconolactonase